MRTMLGWYTDGGPVMLFIALVGIAGLAILLERVYVIVIRSKNNGRVFIERVIQLVRGGKIDDAIKQCVQSTAALPDIGLLILRSRTRDEAALGTIASAAALSVIPRVTRRLQYLKTLSVVAILLGVFGTVNGFHTALLDAGAGGDRDARLSAGLANALAPTAFGVIVAVVLTLGRGYL